MFQPVMSLAVLAWLLTSLSTRADDPGEKKDIQRSPVYVTPIYDYRGPTVNVGEFSRELAEADNKSITNVTARMKKKWKVLSAEQMYVASIRLFDQGHKDEAVYWFYSAQYRSRVFMQALDDETGDRSDELKRRGQARSELQHAAFSVIGVFINEYAIKDPENLGTTVRLVRKEYRMLPDMKVLHPELKHFPEKAWISAQKKVDEGLTEFQQIVSSLGEKKGDAVVDALEGKTPLLKAFESGNKKLYVQLLKDGAAPNFRPRLASCLLHKTAESHDPFWLQTALKHGANPNLKDTGHPYAPGYPLLLGALVARQHANVVLLIEAGADVNERYRGVTPLFKSQQRRLWQSMNALLDAGADPSLPANSPAYSAKTDREHLKHYKNLSKFDYRGHELNRKQYGWDYTLDEEKEIYFKVRARLIKDGFLKPEAVKSTGKQ